MRRLTIVALVAMCVSTASVQLYAAEPAKPSGVSQTDAAALQKGARELGQMFGVEQPKAEPQNPSATPAPKTESPTVAQVMDKAIDKVSDVVGAMAQAISNIAPDVWRIMLKQQYARAIGDLIPWFGVTAIFWIISRSFKKWRQKKIDAKQDYSNDNEYLWACGLYYVSLILTGVMSLFTFMTLGESIRLLINPEYYAIQDLLRMILNRGMP